jgi:hypothetical protein
VSVRPIDEPARSKLLALAAVMTAAALAVRADGAEHPVTIASILVALILVLGGPLLLAAVRRRVARSSA